MSHSCCQGFGCCFPLDGRAQHHLYAAVEQVFVGGELIGGATETIELLQKGSLADRISSAKQPPLPANLQSLVDKAVKDQQVWPAELHVCLNPSSLSA